MRAPRPRIGAPRPRTAIRSARHLALVAGLVLGAAVPARSQIVRQIGLLDSGGLPLRWDNIEGPPLYVEGPSLSWRAGPGMHIAELRERTSLTVKLPPNTLLRVVEPGGVLSPDDLEVTYSEGAGLRVPLSPIASSDPRSLFVFPDSVRTTLIHLRSRAPGRRSLALFVSRIDHESYESRYRTVVPLPCASARLRHPRNGYGVRHWRAAAGRRLELAMEGPARLALFSRLVYGPDDTRAAQSYEARVDRDGDVIRFHHETTVDSRRFRLVDEPIVVSRESAALIEVPAGRHEVRIEFSAPVLCRLLRDSGEDHLLHPLDDGGPEEHVLTSTVRSLFGDTYRLDAFSGFTFEDPSGSAGETYSSPASYVLKNARDNALPDNSLVGAMYFRRLASSLAVHPRDRSAALAHFARHARLLDLLPAKKSGDSRHAAAWMVSRRLRRPSSEDRDVRVSRQHLEESIFDISTGVFVELPRGEDASLEYLLPPRSAPTLLRIAVRQPDALPGTRLAVRLDDGSEETLACGGSPLSPEHYEPTALEKALAARSLVGGRDDLLDLYAAAGRSRAELPTYLVGIAEIPIPEETERVSLRVAGGGDERVEVALQCYEGAARRYTQREFLDALREVPPPGESALFLSLLEQWTRGDVSPVYRALVNEWTPLFLRLRSCRERFRRGVGDAARHVSVAPIGGSGGVRERIAAARERERSGEWLPALEAWAEVIGEGDVVQRREAELGRVRALRALGEDYLAEMQLRGLVLYSEEEILRRKALAELKRMYEEADDPGARLDLVAARAFESDDPLVVADLARALLDGGSHRSALTVALTLPEWAQPLDVVLRSAFHSRWWRVFDEALRRVTDERELGYWRGLRHAISGDHESALAELRAAGPRGAAMARSLREALEIRDELESDSELTRARAVFRWEDWQRERPGPRHWRSASEKIVDYAFTEYVLHHETGGRSFYHGASPERPVVLEVMGPAALRLEVRPLRERGDTEALEGWVEVRRDGNLIPVPVMSLAPLPGLSLWRNIAERPGASESTDLELGPGLHTISVHSPSFPILVRAEEEDVELDPGVLPRLSPATLSSVLRPGLSPARALATFHAGRLRFLPRDGTRHELSAPIRLVDRELGAPLRSLPRELEGELAARLVLRLGARELVDAYRAGLERIASARPELHPDEQHLARRHLGLADDGMPSGADLIWREAALLGAGHPRRVLDLEPPRSRREVRRRMRALLYVAETAAFLRDAAIVEGDALIAAHPGTQGLRGDWMRLTRDREWRRVSAVRDSAGVRHVPLGTGWRPQHPALRARRALIPDLADDEQLITGRTRLVYSLSRLRPTVLRVNVAAGSVGCVEPVPQEVYYELNDWGRRVFRLAAGGPAMSLDIAVPAGDHTLRIGSATPYPNQLLRVRFADVAASAEESPRPEIEESSRLYHVATREKPLWLAVEGPAWLRVDRYASGGATVSYRKVEAGWQDVRLAPEEGEEPALYRVFEHARSDFPPPPALPPPPEQRLPEGPLPRLASMRLESAALPPFLRVRDLFPLGGQEDGTLTVAGLLRRRRNFEEDGDERIIAEQFLELDAVHRYFDSRRDTYFETGLLARVREEGGPVVGAWEDLRFTPSWLPFDLQLLGRAFLQWPNGDALDPAGPSEWSLHGRATLTHSIPLSPKTRVIPGVSVFGREMSLDDREDYRPGRIDNDIFSEFKEDHRHGLLLAGTFIHEPWADARWWSKVTLATNEDFDPFDPDQVRVLVAWKQYILGSEIDLGYQFTHFFSDEDRDGSRNRDSVFLEASQDLWYAPGRRLELGVRYRHDFPDNRNTGFVFVAWHFGNGRDYRDFWPGDVQFRSLRRDLIPPEYNNSVAAEERAAEQLAGAGAGAQGR